MFGKSTKKIEPKKLCKFCQSDKIHHLETPSGFGGGVVYSEELDVEILLCHTCGRISAFNENEQPKTEGVK